MREAIALALAAATAAAAWVPGLGAEPPAPAFEVYHFGSIAEGQAFREVFLVHNVPEGLAMAPADVEVRRDGEPLAVAWEAGPMLGDGDRFSFVQEAFDTKQVLTAHWQGRLVMECAFGGGAGIAITPEEWRAMGLPEEARCLQLPDDVVEG